MAGRILIHGGRLLDGEQTVDVLADGGTITAMGAGLSQADCERVIDARGRLVSPGYVDVHIQGAGGADVLDATPQALETISRTCARFGVTAFLATTVYKAGQDNRHLNVAAECVGQDLGGARLLGIHLEGPFIAAAKRGMIQPDCLCGAEPEVLDEILTATRRTLRMMTIAPELDGALDMIRRLEEAGVVASFGHSTADYEQTLAGIDAGLSHVTHLFNAMVGIHHRIPGPFAAICERRHVTCQLISDGVHVHPAIVRMVWRLLGAGRVVAITDAMQAMGLPDGRYVYNGLEYESRAGAARYADGTLIGTAVGLSEIVARLVRFTGCTAAEAVHGVTAGAAQLLGLDGGGTLGVGRAADIVLLNEDLTVAMTMVGGRIVYER